MVIIGVLITLFFGFSLVKLMRLKLSVYGTVSLAFLLGLGLQTLIMFYIALLHIRLSFLNIAIPIVLLTLVFLILDRVINKEKHILKNEFNRLNKIPTKVSFIEKIALGVFLSICVYVMVAGIYWPVVGWDSIALYDFRAKVFATTGFMDDAIRRGYFFGYPLMTSMAHTWIYLLGSSYPKFLYSLMYISFGILFFEISLKRSSRLISSVFTILMLIAYPLLSQAAYDYTNVPYDIYFFLSSAFLFIWTKQNKNSWLILSALMMGLATWIRSTDPFWTVNIIVLVIWSILNKNFKHLVLYLLFFLPIQQSWSLYLTKMSPNVSSQNIISESLSVVLMRFDFGRLVQIILFIIKNLFGNLAPYALLFVVCTLQSGKKVADNLYFMLILIGNISLLFVGTYVFSFIWEGWGLIGESLGRIGSVFIPLLVFASAINLNLKGLYKPKP